MFEPIELTEEIGNELREKYPGKLHRLNLIEPEQTIIFKRPSWAVYSQSLDQLTDDDESKARAIKGLVDACVVFPSKDAMKELLDDYPGVAGTISKQIQAASGLDLKKTATKF